MGHKHSTVYRIEFVRMQCEALSCLDKIFLSLTRFPDPNIILPNNMFKLELIHNGIWAVKKLNAFLQDIHVVQKAR